MQFTYSHSPNIDADLPCPRCRGSRCVTMPLAEWPPNTIQPQIPCPACTPARVEKKICDRLEAVWAGLSQVQAAKDTPLRDHTEECVRIRARQKTLAAHLAGALRADPSAMMGAEVVTDADLVDAAFSKGENALRPADLFLPPRLLVLQVGCVVGRNKALPKILLGAILRRAQQGRPTWIVDLLGREIGPSHPAWSDELATVLSDWPTVDLEPSDPAVLVPIAQSATAVSAPASAPDAPKDLGPDDVAGLDPQVAEIVRAKGWRHRPQGNGGTRICCQAPTHPDTAYQLSIYDWRARRVVWSKCQEPSCKASGPASKLAPVTPPA